MFHSPSFIPCLLLVSGLFSGCAAETGVPGPDGPSGKEDSGWLSDTSYELGATVSGTVEVKVNAYGWREIQDDRDVQIDLIDQQLRYAKNAAEDNGYRLNLVLDEVEIIDAVEVDSVFVIEYVAVVDLIATLAGNGVPMLQDVAVGEFWAPVPKEPIGAFSRSGESCADPSADHTVADHNLAYYFKPGSRCTLDLTELQVKITDVFERTEAYPEYDQLLGELRDYDGYGFYAALVPNVGDRDPMSRFNAHARMLERDLDLEGTVSEDESFTRYVYGTGDVAIVIDLFDPTKNRFDAQFQEALGEYQLILYNGHSNYGTQNLLNNPEAFGSQYQIIMMHSCQSYAYYTQQVFRAKETADDAHGWDAADVIATGRSSYPAGSPPTLEVLLKLLLEGMDAIVDGSPENAPDWLRITTGMNRVEPGILYGAAGVRENTWRP